MTAALIDRLLCDRCGRCPLPPTRPHDAVCTCYPLDPALSRAAVERRHAAAVQVARRRADWLARHATARNAQ